MNYWSPFQDMTLFNLALLQQIPIYYTLVASLGMLNKIYTCVIDLKNRTSYQEL